MAKVTGANSRTPHRPGSGTAASEKRRSTGTKRTASVGDASRSSGSSTSPRLVVCVNAAGHDDLQTRRLYQVLPDPSAARNEFLRVIDDSGEDYLYPASCFVAVDLPKAVRTAIGA
jgi:hypothetical protein